MTGYTRQSIADIAADEEIKAGPLNAEFNALATAFNSSSGHAHDGTSGSGPKISLTSSVTGNLPMSHIATNIITKDKLVQSPSKTVLGNMTGSTSNVDNVVVLDEDTMVSNSDVSLPTQQSVKAYVDALDAAVVDALDTLTNAINVELGEIEDSISELSDELDAIVVIPKVTVYSSAGSFTHTFDTDTTHFKVEGSGGGGAGAGSLSNSASGTDSHYGHGGNSGWYYETSLLTKGAIISASLVIGAGGTSNAAANTKVNGANTTYDDGTNTFTWDGGLSPVALAAGDTGVQMYQYNQPSTPSTAQALFSSGRFGTRGVLWTGTDNTGSGYGGSTPYGKGGLPVSSNFAGNTGTGNGSGGSGSAKTSGSVAYNGGAGRPGIIIITEWRSAPWT